MAKKRKPIDADKIKKAVRDILVAVGEDVEREGLKDTPDRVARMYAELLGDLGGGERRIGHKGTRHLDLICAEDARTTEPFASAAR